jgi:excisionase family DNA binding protein
MELSDYRSLLEQLETEISAWSPESCTELLGALERVRVTAWSQVVKGPQSLPSQHNGQLLTLPQVAERLAVPETYAYELARQNRLPVVRLGKYVRVSAEEFGKWLAQQASLERRIDREPYDFHSAAGRNRVLLAGRGSKKNGRAAPKSQSKTSVGFRPPVSIPDVTEPGAVKPELSHKEG